MWRQPLVVRAPESVTIAASLSMFALSQLMTANVVEALSSGIQLVKKSDEQGLSDRNLWGVLGPVRPPLLLDAGQRGNDASLLMHRGVEDPSMMIAQGC